MKKIYSVFMITAALTLLWGCSSSDDDEVNNNNGGGFHRDPTKDPSTWTLKLDNIKGAIDGMPEWQVVDFFDYENSMTAIVFLSTELGAHMTEGDRMAAIVDGEVRDICAPVPFFDDSEDEDSSLDCFMLLIPYRPGENEVELQYYNAERNKTYVLQDEFNVTEETVGDDEAFLFTFCPMAIGAFTLPPDLPCKVGEGDKMAAFIGDVCCGVTTYDESVKEDNTWLLTLYNMPGSNEKAYICYYNAETGTVYTTEPYITIKNADFISPHTVKFK